MLRHTYTDCIVVISTYIESFSLQEMIFYQLYHLLIVNQITLVFMKGDIIHNIRMILCSTTVKISAKRIKQHNKSNKQHNKM